MNLIEELIRFNNTDLRPRSMIKIEKKSLLNLNCISENKCKVYVKTLMH